MDRHVKKFHLISPFYQLFFNFQVRFYSELIAKNIHNTGIDKKASLLDLGSGTGAFARSWQLAGMNVLASDRAPGMIRRCRKNGIQCMELDLQKEMPFKENSFQVLTAAYVAHGLSKKERLFLYREAARVAERTVIFHDLNLQKNAIISIIEAIEGSHYADFIRSVPEEMSPLFTEVKVLQVNKWNNWYVCIP